MNALLLQFLSGLSHAMVLFLIASGLSLIFGVTRTINFAHGSFFMLAAYLTTTLATTLPLGDGSFYSGALLASIAVAIFGGVVEVCFLRRVYRAPELYQLLLTFALVLIIGDAVRFWWGPENRIGIRPAGLAGSIAILGQPFPTYDLAVLALGPVVAGGLWVALHRTRWGILVRAAASDREMVGALGVNQAWLFTSAFVVGSWLAGLAGALQVPRQPLTTVMDAGIIVEAFVVVVIGGMGNVFGALLGAVLIGVLQSLGILWLPRELHMVLVFLLMAAVLIIRPWGLVGRPPTALPAPEGGPGVFARGVHLPRGVAACGVLLLLLVPLAVPPFVLLLLVEILAFALFAGSLQLLVGSGGLLCFGHAAYFGLGAYGAALLMKQGGASDAGGLGARAALRRRRRAPLRLLLRAADRDLVRHAHAGVRPNRVRDGPAVVWRHGGRQRHSGDLARPVPGDPGAVLLSGPARQRGRTVVAFPDRRVPVRPDAGGDARPCATLRGAGDHRAGPPSAGLRGGRRLRRAGRRPLRIPEGKRLSGLSLGVDVGPVPSHGASGGRSRLGRRTGRSGALHGSGHR